MRHKAGEGEVSRKNNRQIDLQTVKNCILIVPMVHPFKSHFITLKYESSKPHGSARRRQQIEDGLQVGGLLLLHREGIG